MLRSMTESSLTPMRAQRLRRGWTQAELAAKCTEEGARVNDSQVSKIERGVCQPVPRLRVVLARLLDLDPVDLGPKTRASA